MTNSITYTPNLKLTKLPENYHVWAQIMNNNLSIIDASIATIFGIPGFNGIWTNSTHYLAGVIVADSTTGVLYQCSQEHTSSTLPTTFAQDRTNFPTYWNPYLSGQVYQSKGVLYASGTSGNNPPKVDVNELSYDELTNTLFVAGSPVLTQSWYNSTQVYPAKGVLYGSGTSGGNVAKADASELSYDEVLNVLYIGIDTVATQTWVNGQGFALATSLANYLPLAGGTLTGQLNTVKVAPTASYSTALGDSTHYWNSIYGKDLQLAATAGNDRSIYFRADPFLARWTIRVDNATESGSNAGSNLDIDRWSDAGSFIDTLLSFDRASGTIRSYPSAAIPAGGNLNQGLFVSSTANFGVTYGSGAPTIAAARGSLYLRSDGAPYYNTDGTGTGWVQIGTGSGGGVSISDTAPASPSAGNLWWKSDTGVLYIYYNDGNSSQWVPATPTAQPSSGWRLISRVTPAAAQASIDFQNIPSDINSIELHFDAIPTATGSQLLFRVFDNTNTISTTGYGFVGTYAVANATSGTAAQQWNAGIASISNGIPLLAAGDAHLTNGAFGIIRATNIRDAARIKRFRLEASSTNGAATNNYDFSGTGYWSAATFTGVRLLWTSTTFAAGGSVALWGSP